jgi:hypothetical protein
MPVRSSLSRWGPYALLLAACVLLSCRNEETEGIRSSDLVGSWRLSDDSVEENGVVLGGYGSTRLGIGADGNFSASSIPIQFIRVGEKSPATFNGSGRWSFEPRTGTLKELVLRFSNSSLGNSLILGWEVRRSGASIVIIESRLGPNGRAVMFVRIS